MSAPQGRSRRKLAEEEDEVISMVGQRVWFVDQIEPVGTVRETIPKAGAKVVGFIIEDDKTGIVRKVQRSRVRKYGDRYFLVTSWFARADQAARELEKQLSKGLTPDRDLRYWQQFSERLGQDTLKMHLGRVAPPTYAVAGQLASAAETLSQDLARAGVGFRRVQRALVANQSVMSPEEYAQFVDEARKWSRTVRLVLMAVEFMARSLPRAQIDVRNPDAPLPAVPVYIPFEALLEAHTPGGEGKARERPPAPTVEGGDGSEFAEVFEEEGQGEWQEAEDFEADGTTPGEFAPLKPLREYEGEGFEALEPQTSGGEAVEAFEEVAPEPEVEAFEEVEVPQAQARGEVPVFEEAPPAPPPKPPVKARAPSAPAAPTPPPAAAVKGAPAKAAAVEALPEDDEGPDFRASRGARDSTPGQWLTPPSPPPPKAAQVRQAERQERSKDLGDLDAIIAASLGRTPKKSTSKASQGEIAAGGEAQKGGTDALSRDLASLLEKSKRR
jgi:hypothetical protein